MDLDYDDLQYQGISDLSNLIYPISINLLNEPELIHSSFNRGYEKYQIKGDADKKSNY